MVLDGRLSRGLVLLGVEVYLHTTFTGRQRAKGRLAHLLTTHAVLPFLVSERSDTTFLYCDPVRLLQRLTHRPCGDLSVLVVPGIASMTLRPRVDTTYVKMPRQVVLIVLVVRVCVGNAKNSAVVFRTYPTHHPPWRGHFCQPRACDVSTCDVLARHDVHSWRV